MQPFRRFPFACCLLLKTVGRPLPCVGKTRNRLGSMLSLGTDLEVLVLHSKLRIIIQQILVQ
jgi:hypothetical protein